MKPLLVHPIKTRIFHPHENLKRFILETTPRTLIGEKMILAITSKIVSLAEGCLVSHSRQDKASLVYDESDSFLGEIGFGCFLTIKNGLLIPSAGIDESNSETGDYILYPRDPFQSAKLICEKLKVAWNLKEFGIILTDSHTTPLRRGVTGVCLSYWGFHGVKNLVGTKDLFERDLQMTQMNYADGLAASAVMMMGEGRESRPLAVIHNSEVEFTDSINPKELQIPLTEDLYYPLLKAAEGSKDFET